MRTRMSFAGIVGVFAALALDMANGKVRTGPQFSFDVGPASPALNDSLRMLFTAQTSDGHFHLDAIACDATRLACTSVPASKSSAGASGSES